MMRINKYISQCGICSRRKAEKLILSGQIFINGEQIKELAYKVKKSDIVVYKGKILEITQKKYYLALNKPIGYTCTNEDKFAKKTIFDLINIDSKLFSIGRLDKDSHGLILVTNDGDIYNNIIHPRNHIYKDYLVKLEIEPSLKDLDKLCKGLLIDGYITQKAKIKKIDSCYYKVSICEGKNRQIRKMFALIGSNVLDLQRISVGNIKLGKLKLGEYRNLSSEEIDYLNSL